MSALILGDNIFYGHGLPEQLLKAAARGRGITVFGYVVNNSELYGVVELDDNGRAVSIEEKPKLPKSNIAVTCLYFYGNDAVHAALKPSPGADLKLRISTASILRAVISSLKCSAEVMPGSIPVARHSHRGEQLCAHFGAETGSTHCLP